MNARSTLASVPALLLLYCACDPTMLDPVSQNMVVSPPQTQLGLISHWTFDESAGNVVHDSAGTYNGMLTGGNWQPAGGHFGGALSLTHGQNVDVPAFPAATASFSVSLWVRFRQGDLGSNRATLISNQISGGGWEINAPDGSNPGRIEFAYPRPDPNQMNWISARCCNPTPEVWTHITAVLDGEHQSITVYEGVNPSIMVRTMGVAIPPGSSDLFMGTELGERQNSTFQGTVDEIRIYNRALTAAEVGILDKQP